ncbi:MAG: RNA polymerase sigma factor [Candidatus Zixiibacteriota bacterium]
MNDIRDEFWKQVEPEHLKARAFCRKLAGNRDDGDDLYQDCLIRALSRFEHVRDKASFNPWLYRIIINVFKNRVQSPWWKRMLFFSDGQIEPPARGNPSAAQAARHRLDFGFKAISPTDRALIVLFELHGWSIAEIAAMTGRSEGAVKVRLSRARIKMRRAIEEHLRRTGQTRHELVTKDEICVAVRSAKD